MGAVILSIFDCAVRTGSRMFGGHRSKEHFAFSVLGHRLPACCYSAHFPVTFVYAVFLVVCF